MTRRALAILLLAGVAAARAAAAAEPVLEVQLPAGELRVGDLAVVTLVVDTGDAVLDAPPRFPSWGEAWGSAEIVEIGEAVRAVEDDRVIHRQPVVLQAFRPGEVALPPVVVAVPLAGGTRTLSTPADLALTVASVLPPVPAEAGAEGAIPPPQPAAPPQPLPIGAAFWWTAGVGTALLVALLVPMLLRRRRARAGASAVLLEPLPELAAALAAARASDDAVEGHARLSLALRRYLGRRLSFPAGESTTSEVQRQLLARHLTPGLPRRAIDLLRACDLVKFARRRAELSDVDRWAGEAEAVAAALETHLAPAEPETAPGEEAA